jgi:hypothetical protein
MYKNGGYVMPWVVAAAAVAAGGAYMASKEASKGAKEAARIQAEQEQKALEAQQAAYEPYKPYLMESLQRYQGLLEKPESIKQQPGYLFRLQQGLEAAGIPANGRFLSGAQIRAATQYGQQYASNEYQGALNQAAGLGSLAAQNYQPAAQYAGAVSNIYGNLGKIQAQGVLGASQARAAGILGVTGAISSGLSAYGGGAGGQSGQNANQYYYGSGQTSGYGSNVSGDAYGPAYSG